MQNATKRQTRGEENAGDKAKRLANAPETKARFEGILRELTRSFAGIYKREPSEEEEKALRSYALASTAFLAMAGDAGENG